MLLLYHYDRWRGITPVNNQSNRLKLAGPPYNAEAGSFSFFFTPELNNGGLYSCEVFLNENVYKQRTLLSVFKGTDLCENDRSGELGGWGQE